MRVIISLVVYLFFGIPMVVGIYKTYKQMTSDENYDRERIWKITTYLVYMIFLMIFMLVFGSVLVYKDLWKITYENYLKMVKVSFILTGILSYTLSKYGKNKSKIDVFLEKRIFIFVVPFLIIISVIEKII